MHEMNPKHKAEFILNHVGKPVEKWWKTPRSSMIGLASCICLGAASASLLCSAASDPGGKQAKPMINAAVTESQPESYESYQLRILRNQNHIQAEKIKVLREEIHEVTQKLHELKPHLFKHGDPADQVKIAQMTQLLSEKEETLNQLTTTKEQLEKDLNAAKRKLDEMEIVKEALAAMVDSHREAKEKSSVEYQKQIESLQLLADQEKNDLLRKIQQHEAVQNKLNYQMTAKTETINRLDELTTKLNSHLAEKGEELTQLEGHILALYDIILQTNELNANQAIGYDKQIQDVITALDFEKTRTYQLQLFQEEMQWLYDIYDGTQKTLAREISQLEEQLANEKNKSSQLSEENQLALKTLRENTSELQELAELIEFERIRNQTLETQLYTLFKQTEADAHHLDKVETELYEMNSRLASKHDELENATSEFIMNLAALLAHLDTAETDAETSANALREANAHYHNQVGTLLAHLDQHDKEYHDAKTNHEEGMGALFSHLDFEEQASNSYMKDFVEAKVRFEAILDKHRQKEEALQKSLEEMYQAYKQENHRMAQLELQLEEERYHTQLSNLNLITHKVINAAHEERFNESTLDMDALSGELAKESARSIDLHLLLQDTLAQNEQLAKALEDSQVDLQNTQHAYLALENSHQGTTSDLSSKLEALLQNYEVECHTTSGLENQLQETLETLDVQTLRNEELEFRLDRISEELAQATQAVHASSDKIEELTTENDLLNTLLIQAQETEALLENFKSEHHATKNQLEEVAYENSRLHTLLNETQETAALVDSLKAEVNANASHIEEKTNEIDRLQNLLQQSQETEALLKHLQTELYANTNQLEETKLENNRLRNLLNQAQESGAQLETVKSELSANINRLEEITNENHRLQSLLEHAQETETSLIQLKEQFNANLRELENKTTENYRLHHSLEQAEAMLENMKKDIIRAEDNLTAMSELETLLEQQRQQLEDKEHQIHALTQTNTHPLNSVNHEAKLQEVQEQLYSANLRINSLQQDLEYAQSNYQRERSHLMNLEKILNENNNRLRDLKELTYENERLKFENNHLEKLLTETHTQDNVAEEN